MYNQNYKVELPQFPDREVSIAEYGAKSGDLQIETGRHNAEAINRAICEVSEQGGGTVRVPAGIWAVAPIRLLSDVNLHLDSQAMLKFIKSKEDYPLRITSYEGQDCIRTVSPVTAENAENIAITGEGIIDGSGDKWRPVKKFKMTAKQWDALFTISPYVLETKETAIWMPTESILKGNHHNIQGNTEEALAAGGTAHQVGKIDGQHGQKARGNERDDSFQKCDKITHENLRRCVMQAGRCRSTNGLCPPGGHIIPYRRCGVCDKITNKGATIFHTACVAPARRRAAPFFSWCGINRPGGRRRKNALPRKQTPRRAMPPIFLAGFLFCAACALPAARRAAPLAEAENQKQCARFWFRRVLNEGAPAGFAVQ